MNPMAFLQIVARLERLEKIIAELKLKPQPEPPQRGRPPKAP